MTPEAKQLKKKLKIEFNYCCNPAEADTANSVIVWILHLRSVV